MAMASYILIKTDVGEPTSVLKQLKRLPNLKEAHMVTGEYDIIAFLEIENLKEVGNVVSKIQDFKGVTSTLTSVVIA